MIEREFRDRIRAIFRRSPLVPAVLETTGGRVIADMPEQLEMGSALVTVRQSGGVPPVRINYEEIERVVALDELPADRLSYADFYAAVRPLLRAEPYQPFLLELFDGTRLVICSPNRLALAGRFGVYLPPNSRPFVHFSYDQVARVDAPD
jgi:hypothetical protein